MRCARGRRVYPEARSPPFRLYKHFTHEGGIATPCIAHWPAGIPRRHAWERRPAHVMDVMPTLCELAGIDYPEERESRTLLPLEGRSLVSAWRGDPLPERALGFEHQGARALRQGPWKLVWGQRMPEPPRWELYHLGRDPCETRDLAGRHPERVQAMAASWEAWARRVGVKGF